MTEPLNVIYRNWRGEVSTRQLTPQKVWFGSTEWHPVPQWLLTATADTHPDVAKDYALADMCGVGMTEYAVDLASRRALDDVEEIRRLRAEVEALVEGNGLSAGVDAIAAERRRQIDLEGWTAQHDDGHRPGALAAAGASYALHAAGSDNWRKEPRNMKEPPMWWPFGKGWWKPRDRRADLMRAGALIAAEIDRLDRVAAGDLAMPETERAGQE